MEGSLTFLQTYGLVVAGIAISIVLPILRVIIPTPPEGAKGKGDAVKLYLLVGLFSLLTALVVVALTDVLPDWRAALLAGYAWDSTVQKVRVYPV